MTDRTDDKLYETIIVSRSGGVATLRFNRPAQRNSIGGPMMEELYGALTLLANDPEVRILVVRGEGRDFCPGADVKHYGASGAEPAAPRWSSTDTYKVSVFLHEMPAVTIAAIRGACAGAGFGWACACDFRLADDTARFNNAFLDVGVAGDMGGPWTLPRIVGAAKARELCFLPGKFDAEEALRIGLVSRVAKADEFEAELLAFTHRLESAAPLALATLKSNFVVAERSGFADYIAIESERHIRLFQTQDTTEAFKAFVEKRKPVFKGH
jgi:2-(1,2-epoxy-1,2-dihydrophenyl)acetyl-CoA isomerase